MKRIALILTLVVCSCTQVAQFPILPADQEDLVLVDPFQAWKDLLGRCVDNQRCWSDMTQEQIRNELSLFESKTIVSKVNKDGTLSHFVSSIGAEAGRYRVTQYAMSYINLPCNQSDPSAGIQRVGVGVRVTADLRTRKRNINLGGFIPIAIAANDEKVSGEIQINSWGISADDRSLSTYLNSGGLALNEDGIQRAIETMAVARVLMDNPTTKLSPWTLAVREREQGSCSA